MKKWIKWLIRGVVSLLIVILLTVSISQGKHNKTLKNEVKHQQVVIDSLLKMERNSVEIQLFVTDKSVNKIYGRYNKGTISMPTEKSYTLEVDSVRLFK